MATGNYWTCLKPASHLQSALVELQVQWRSACLRNYTACLPVSCLSAGMGTMFIERPSKAYKSEHRVTGRVDRKDFLFIGFEQKYW